jgi:hypothetical protein
MMYIDRFLQLHYGVQQSHMSIPYSILVNVPRCLLDSLLGELALMQLMSS